MNILNNYTFFSPVSTRVGQLMNKESSRVMQTGDTLASLATVTVS